MNGCPNDISMSMAGETSQMKNPLMSNVFVTSDGRAIDLIPGWFEQKVWPLGAKSYQEFVDRVIDPQVNEESSHDDEVYPKSPVFFLRKLITPEAILQVLEESMIHFEGPVTLLDIGSGAAIIPRVLKLLGVCDAAYGVDIQDRSGDFSDQALTELISEVTRTLLQDEQSDVMKLLRGGDGVSTWTVPFSLPFVADMNRNLSMDGYYVSDFLKFDGAGRQYDLITTYAGLCYFDIRDYFEKVASLLNRGGVHYLMDTNYYHYYGESLELPLDAPWLHARVTRDDLFRYYREHHPDLESYVERGFFQKSSHCAVKNVIACAREFGLEALSYRRSYKTDELEKMHYRSGANLKFILQKVLTDCQAINPHVTYLDLISKAWTIVFKKAS